MKFNIVFTLSGQGNRDYDYDDYDDDDEYFTVRKVGKQKMMMKKSLLILRKKIQIKN